MNIKKKEEIKKRYFSLVNMNKKELLKWLKTKTSKLVASDRKSIESSLSLLDKKEWTDRDAKKALKLILAINKLKRFPSGERLKIQKSTITLRDAVLKNYGHDLKTKKCLRR